MLQEQQQNKQPPQQLPQRREEPPRFLLEPLLEPLQYSTPTALALSHDAICGRHHVIIYLQCARARHHEGERGVVPHPCRDEIHLWEALNCSAGTCGGHLHSCEHFTFQAPSTDTQENKVCRHATT